MSGDFAISPVQPHVAVTSVAAASETATSQATFPDPAAAVSAASNLPLANFRLHLDLALNLVVLQFVDDNGNVTNSFPSAKQLQAYKVHQSEPVATPAPVPTPVATTATVHHK